MTSRIRTRREINEKKATFQRNQSADKFNEYQKLKQILAEKFKNWKNIFQNNIEDVATLLSEYVDYVELVAKKKTKAKNLKIKRKYLIL